MLVIYFTPMAVANRVHALDQGATHSVPVPKAGQRKKILPAHTPASNSMHS
jgi:hypothetical protein